MSYPRISSVYGWGEAVVPPMDLNEVKRDAWHHLGLLVIDPEDEPNHQKRQDLIDTGDKHYGRRGPRG